MSTVASYISPYIKKFDWPMIMISVLLCAIGLLFIYHSPPQASESFYKQIAFFFIGIVLMFVFSFIDWRIFRDNSYLILILYFISLLGLAGLFFFAPDIRGVKSWYKIGEISIDPIEFAKVVLIILLAKYFSTRHIELYRFRHILLSGFYVALPVALIFLQPDLGSTLILVALWIGVLILSGIKVKHFLILVLAGVLIFAFSWNTVLKDYQKERLMSFIEPIDPLGINWNQNQAKIAIGSGGVFGQGIGSGSQSQYGFLPEVQTDFIFSSIAEQTGLVGVMLLLTLFGILIWRIFKIAINAQGNFSRLFATGFGICLITQVFIHVGMNLGLLPIIGISLPFVRYGGSGLIGGFIILGILNSLKE